MNNYILGIDVGTTSVKVCAICAENNAITAEISEPTLADVVHNSRSNEQDVTKIVNTLQKCITTLKLEILQRVIGIGICGQVHGIVFWNSEDRPWTQLETKHGILYEIDGTKISHLFTWQDGRCDSNFLSNLPTPDSHLKAYTGYGCNTIFWLSRYQPEKIAKFDSAGTIADFIVCMICDLGNPVFMSTQNSASWGYFNTKTCEWNKEILIKENFPVHFLPIVVQPEEIVGNLSHSWCNIPAKVPVGSAWGDLQCSVFAALESIEDAFMNISTSAQLVFVDPYFQPEKSAEYSVEYIIPYFNKTYLVAAALLNGGNALTTFVRSLQHWFKDLNVSVSTDEIWKRLSELLNDNNSSGNDSDLTVVPMFLGERFAPNERASITNITPENFNLRDIFRAICRGIIQNLHSVMPSHVLADAGIKRIVGSGSALIRNQILQNEVKNIYDLPIVFNTKDSPYGAALFMRNLINK